jgi:zona occludens toxin
VVSFIIVASFASFFAYRFFNPKHVEKKVVEESKNVQQHVAYSSAPLAYSSAINSSYSESWRIAGYIDNGLTRYIVLSDQTGKLRVESPSNFQNAGMALVGVIDGKKVTVWTGGPSQASTISEASKP